MVVECLAIQYLYILPINICFFPVFFSPVSEWRMLRPFAWERAVYCFIFHSLMMIVVLSADLGD